MRILLALPIANSPTQTVAWGQQASAQKESPAMLLKQLHSDEPIVRNDALKELRHDPAALQDPRIKSALVNLLDRENHVTLDSDDEGYAEYVGWLTEAVVKVVDWNDQRQVCILANTVYLPAELADHAKASVPCLFKAFKVASDRHRGSVMASIARAFAKARSGPDRATLQEVQQTMLGELNDPDVKVRSATAWVLGQSGGEDMIPALKAVAETDPAPEVNGKSVRKRANEAIAEIQKRAAAGNSVVPTK
jgi:HEAT repeat protein